MFDPVPPNVSFPDQERALIEFWRSNEIFRRSVEERRGGPRFTFYEGPPTANGSPHWGSVLTRVGKDVFLRYWTMRGYYAPRRSGWDTHGLPVETEVEKELGIHGKRDVEKYGIETFARECIASVWRYIGAWEEMSERVGFWLEKDGYATYHRYYVESVWWALSEFFKKGLLYQGYKSVWWWPQGGTALSQGEVGEGYRPVDDPSVVVRFAVTGREKTFFIAWTTTPWTLPSNLALAVAADETYVEVESEGETLILAEALVESALEGRESNIVKTFPGRDLEGLKYEPLYRFREPESGKSWEVGCADFVTLDTGTGIVHIAPGFGEDDFRFAKDAGFGFIQLVEPDGKFSADTDFAGMYFKDVDKKIIQDLKARGLLFNQKTVRHDYPFCPRAPEDALIQYARRGWFIRTSTEKDQVVANNAKVRWQPEHIRDGRMGDFLRNNVDWAISRERWWGTPLPIWKNDETGNVESVASVDEILERNPDAFAHWDKAKAADPELDDNLMVHRPWIDHVTWTKDGEPGVYRRAPEVIDCWFDAGSMPFAQWGYPHRNKEQFEESFPADFITESLDQTRGWWNALLQISTLLFPERETPHPFKSCVVVGVVTDEHGKKLAKRLKNFEPPMEALENSSADAVRWALLHNGTPAQNLPFNAGIARNATRDLLLKVWNIYSFLVTYARIDKWDPKKARPPIDERATLDRWILAELDATVRDVRAAFERLETHTAARRLQGFIDGLSNWYLRRSRARFWADGESADKNAAFATLYEALCETALLLAPFTPFIAETLYQALWCGNRSDACDSVHLAFYPEPNDDRVNDDLRKSMSLARDLVSLGQRVRSTEKLKVRQPLAEAIVVLAGNESLDAHTETIAEELNVHTVSVSDEPAKYVEFEIVPNFRALGPKLGKRMPLCKKCLADADGSALHDALEKVGAFDLDVDGETVRLTRDEIEVRLKAREGYVAASEGGRVVVLDTRVTPELKREGLAREAVNRLQSARKTMDLAYEARIAVRYEAGEELAEALATHRDQIAGETLSTKLEQANPTGEIHETEIDGEPFRFGIVVES